MSKRAPKNLRANPPFLAAGFICEKVLREQDKVLTAVRIIDSVFVPPLNLKLGDVLNTPLTIFFSFRSGGHKGEEKFTLFLVGPSGKRRKLLVQGIRFDEPPERGVNIQIQLHFPWDGEGLYWFESFLGRRFVTSTPLRIGFQKKQQ